MLKATPDMARALSRLALDRGGPRDLAALRDGLAAALAIAVLLGGAEALPPELAETATALASTDAALAGVLAASLA